MTNTEKFKCRQWMQRELRKHPEDYFVCGEINSTALAENYSNINNYFADDEYTIPQDVFDIAAEVAIEEEKAS